MNTRHLVPTLLGSIWLGLALNASSANALPAKALIYTRNHVSNGTGFVHDNIAVSVAAVKELCAEKDIASDVTDNPEVFTPENLKQYGVILFCNSNNEAFSHPSQSQALTDFVWKNGGGFVGIHSASGSERNNPAFKRLLGGTFKWHTPNQPFAMIVKDAKHPATAHLPAVWKWKDEGYLCELIPDLHILLELDTTSVPNPPRAQWSFKFDGNRYPLAWCHQPGKGRSFYTALGHDKESYADPLFRKHIQQAILWAMGRTSNHPIPNPGP